MAKIQILPGFGGAYQSVAIGSTDTVISSLGSEDWLDLSPCQMFAIQVQSTTTGASGSVQPMQSFNSGVSFIAMGTAISIHQDFAALYDATDAPFGLIRIDPTAILAGSIKLNVVGFNTTVR